MMSKDHHRGAQDGGPGPWEGARARGAFWERVKLHRGGAGFVCPCSCFRRARGEEACVVGTAAVLAAQLLDLPPIG